MTDADRLTLRARLRPLVEHALDRMIDAVADAPDAEMFRAVECQLRDTAHDLAAQVHQTGLDARKKGATKAPPGSAPPVMPMPASSPTVPAPS